MTDVTNFGMQFQKRGDPMTITVPLSADPLPLPLPDIGQAVQIRGDAGAAIDGVVDAIEYHLGVFTGTTGISRVVTYLVTLA